MLQNTHVSIKVMRIALSLNCGSFLSYAIKGSPNNMINYILVVLVHEVFKMNVSLIVLHICHVMKCV